jgi:hypothetical protein
MDREKAKYKTPGQNAKFFANNERAGCFSICALWKSESSRYGRLT